MKAWNDLKNDPDVELWTIKGGEYYIDMGIRIERKANGGIEIRSVMCSGDRFKRLTPLQMDYFRNLGWLAGCARASIDELEIRVDKINKRLRSKLPEERKQKQYKLRTSYMQRIFTYNQILQKEINSVNK
jgi:hypothetical protein